MAPKSAQSVFFRMSMVRCGSASPSLHQKSQPMSAGMYSASNFIASSTMRAASITSLPTPSPGIQAILYFLGIVNSPEEIHHGEHGEHGDGWSEQPGSNGRRV